MVAEASSAMPFVISNAPIASARKAGGSAQTTADDAIGSLNETKNTIAAQSLSMVCTASCSADGRTETRLAEGRDETGLQRSLIVTALLRRFSALLAKKNMLNRMIDAP